MDAKNIERFVPGSQRTFLLHSMIDRLIRGEVVTRYTFVDELLTDIICNYYFKRPKVGHYGRLWKTKKFQRFVHYLMDETFLLKKLAMVEEILAVPKEVSSAIKRINDTRNALAHSLFPENR